MSAVQRQQRDHVEREQEDVDRAEHAEAHLRLVDDIDAIGGHDLAGDAADADHADEPFGIAVLRPDGDLTDVDEFDRQGDDGVEDS